MTWLELTRPGPVVRRRSQVDSDRFGFPVDRVTTPVGGPDPVEAVLDSDADVVIVRFPATMTGVSADLVRRGLRVLPADTLVYWHLDVADARLPDRRDDLGARTLTRSDETTDALVDDLVADIFAGYGNHYVANPAFHPALVLAGYQQWARGAVEHGGTVVVSEGGSDVALATLDVNQSLVEIELAGVATRHQGRGIYPHVLAAVVARTNAREVVISTQAHNAGVQRAWARFGFLPAQAFTTLHVLGGDVVL
jgi:ribosomal protein S18 acetylase RimI-like enzyme